MRPSVITPQRPRTPLNARKRLAHHEAGHAVLSAAINDAPHHVGIVGDEHTQGHSSQRMIGRPSSLAQVYLAGFAAEHILTGRRARQLDQGDWLLDSDLQSHRLAGRVRWRGSA